MIQSETKAKAYNWLQARENGQAVPRAGKRTTDTKSCDVKGGKIKSHVAGTHLTKKRAG